MTTDTDAADATVDGATTVAAVVPIRFAALSVPIFRWYWILSWISNTGDGMENVIRSYLILQLVGLNDAPLWLAVMVFAHWVPFTFFSLYGGTLADRYDNRVVQIVSQVLLFTAAVGVAYGTLSGVVTVWWIFGLLLAHGFAGAIGSPAQQTLIHAIVGRDKLLSAVSLSSTARQFSQVIGPAIAGFVVVSFGPGWGFLINALTFLPLLAFLAVVRVPRLHEGERKPMLEALREGVSFVRRRPLLGSLISIEMLGVVFLGHTFSSLLIVLAAQHFPETPLAYSYLLVASGVGAVLAALYLGYARERRRTGVFIAATAMVEMLAIVLVALTTSWSLSLALMFVVGASAVVTQSLTNTTLQLAAPDRIRGRVMGAYSFGTQGMRILNGPILGGLAVAIGTPLAIASSAGFVFLALGGVLLAVPQLRGRD